MRIMKTEAILTLSDAEPVLPEVVEDGSPLPDQVDVEAFGTALGITYRPSEELWLGDKEHERDLHRWELDPASAEDYKQRK
jgi:hypothetical protein